MSRFRRLIATLRRWRHADRIDRDLQDEVEGYAQMLADEARASGLPPDEARRLALAELGSVEAVKESVRQSRAGIVVEQTWQDVRYAFRSLRRTPAFAATAVVTLALGLGASAVIFSVVDATLFKPLPYRDPGRLVDLGHRARAGTPDEVTVFGMSWGEVQFWRARSEIFTGVESYYNRPAPVEDGDSGEPVQVSRFTAGLPALLGISPEMGRVFTSDEARTAAPVAVISDRYWRQRFGGSTAALGATIRLGRRAVTVVGVLPPEFRYGPGTGGRTDVWEPLGGNVSPGDPAGLTLFRLRPPLDPVTALPAIRTAAARLQAIRPEDHPWTPELSDLDQRERSTRTLASPLWAFLAMSGVVVLIVCANLGNLLRVRFVGRRDELAMRAALGAGRARLVRLLLIEGAFVVTIGGVAAGLLAAGLIRALPGVVPSSMGRALFAVSLPVFDTRVAGFGTLLLATVALLTIVAPAVRGARRHRPPGTAIVSSHTTWAPDRRRTIGHVQALQMALALLLTTIAALVADGFIHLRTADLGFRAAGLYSVSLSLPVPRYADHAAQLAWYQRVLGRVRHLPDVAAAAYGTEPPASTNGGLWRPGDALGAFLVAARRTAGDGYFGTAGIPVIEGRTFAAGDGANGEPVVVVSASAARRLWPGQPAVGKLIRTSFSGRVPPARVVGVVGDVARYDFTLLKPAYGLYVPFAQKLTPSATLVVRARRAGAPVVREVEDVLRMDEPDVRITSAGAVTRLYEAMETFAAPTFFALLTASFALIALVTAAVGLYGLLAYAVGQREREIGVRVAVGATVGQIKALVLADALRPLGVGLTLGWIAAWILARYLGSLLYGASPHDALAFLTSGGVLLLTALVSTLAPVRRATGVDPIRALRVE